MTLAGRAGVLARAVLGLRVRTGFVDDVQGRGSLRPYPYAPDKLLLTDPDGVEPNRAYAASVTNT